MKKIIITEEQLKFILKENPITDKISSIKKTVEDVIRGNLHIYKNVIPVLGNKLYGEKTVKSDAFRHILASAFFTTTIGGKLTWLGGESVEILGALRNYLKGEGFDSGWAMDSLNNKIGIELGKKHGNMEINELAKKVKTIVDNGDFYTKNKILFKYDKNPKF